MAILTLGLDNHTEFAPLKGLPVACLLLESSSMPLKVTPSTPGWLASDLQCLLDDLDKERQTKIHNSIVIFRQ